MTTQLRVRRSILDLQHEYEQGNKKPLEDLMRAWKGIKDLPADDPKSFFNLAGYHGEPFWGAGWGVGNNYFWGGYCNHGNVLFPTWHRVYLFNLEESLRSIPGCEAVTLPYWDETDDYSLKNGIPWPLTVQNVELDGETIPNPLRSFVFPEGISDSVPSDDNLYTKPKGYETVRYPLSGLVGNAAAQKQTNDHNDNFPDYDRNVDYLNFNVRGWLGTNIVVNGVDVPTGIAEQFRQCLHAPNYTVFSNTSSAQQWNTEIWMKTGENPAVPVVPLESPHNSIHLSVGGFDVPGQGDFSEVADANGDMGENNTAAFDPIFYFHHCNIDRVFWLWQQKHNATDKLDLIEFYPGTNSSDNQGSTPGVAPNTWLTLDTPLHPFKRGDSNPYFTSMDCINVETQLGYTYTPGSLQDEVVNPPTFNSLMATEANAAPPRSSLLVKVSNLNRATHKGSFVISAFAKINGRRQLIGHEAVLSRWNVVRCANCQTHLEVKAFFGLPAHLESAVADLDPSQIEIRVQARNPEPTPATSATTDSSTATKTGTTASKRFHVEVLNPQLVSR